VSNNKQSTVCSALLHYSGSECVDDVRPVQLSTVNTALRKHFYVLVFVFVVILYRTFYSVFNTDSSDVCAIKITYLLTSTTTNYAVQCRLWLVAVYNMESATLSIESNSKMTPLSSYALAHPSFCDFLRLRYGGFLLSDFVLNVASQ